jgi:hypothetical protein
MFFSTLSLFICLSYIFVGIIKIAKTADKLNKLKEKSEWDDVAIKIIKEGYFIEYEYPNKYTKDYSPNLSEVEIINAASYELEKMKERFKRRSIEKKKGNVTIQYRTEDGRLRNKITLTNNALANYMTLINKKDKSKAFMSKDNPNLVLLSIPNDLEIKSVIKSMSLKLIKKSSIFLFFSFSILISAVYF